MNRRNFLKYLGGTAALTFAGCNNSDKSVRNIGNTESNHKETTGGMTYRITPTTGDKVSLLGYGCMRLPVKTDGSGEIDQDEVNRSVDYALSQGVNYFDSAPVYCKGKSEESMGIALSRHPRDTYFIATKMSNFDESMWPIDKSIKIFENSLKYFKTDHIDYLLLHGVGVGGMDNLNKRFIDNGLLDYLVEQREVGRIRNLGFSYHGDIEVFDYLLSVNDKYNWDFVQIQLNYVDWLHAKELSDFNTNASYLYEELQKRGIPAVIMEPLLGGRLASLNNHLTSVMKQHRPNNSVASWAFRFAGSPEGVLTVLSGMTYMEHLIDNVNTYSPLEPLSEEEKKMLEAAAKEIISYPIVPCTQCNYCMPCPYGLDIPGIFQHYNKCINDGEMPEGTRDVNYEKNRKKFLAGYNRKVDPVRQADHCTGCKICTEHCPQGINIPGQMKHIEDVTEAFRQKLDIKDLHKS